jgi:toxin HigB-1
VAALELLDALTGDLTPVTYQVTLFEVAIRRFWHAGLAPFWVTGSRAGIQPVHAARLLRVLTALQGAGAPQDLAVPGLRLHPLKGPQAGRWAVTITGNWRITFAFTDQEVTDVDYEDYH